MATYPDAPPPNDGDNLGPAADPFPFPGREEEALAYRQNEAARAQQRDPAPVRNRNNGEEWELRDPETDELTFAANSTKGMPHDEIGEVTVAFDSPVEQKAYEQLLRAVNTLNPADFDAIPTGPNPDPNAPNDPVPEVTRPFVDPQAGVAFDLEGPDAPSAATYRGTLDPQQILLAPTFPEAELAADVGEVYLMALLRDVPLNALQGATSPNADVEQAVTLMNGFSRYRGPVDPESEEVTAQTLFRGGNVLAENGRGSQNVGELVGPYLSQFMIIGSRLDNEFPPQRSPGKREAGTAATGVPQLARTDGEVLYGTLTVSQKQFEVQPGLDFVTDYRTWRRILQGVFPEDLENPNDRASQYTGQRRFLYSLRQMAEYVHRDQTFQEGLIAALLIISMNERAERLRMADPNAEQLFNDGNAYLGVPNQTGFGTFGNGHVLALLAEATTRAVKAAWAQKWFNQRRLRPEVLGGRIHNTVTGEVKEDRYNLNQEIASLTVSPGKEILEKVAARNKAQNEANGREQEGDSFLLPQQYPEGSPTHPSYPAGHATQIAAEVTVLKGLFNEDFPITGPQDRALVPSADGTALEPYNGPGGPDIVLTLGGELNKLAANVSLARSLAGVHYRLDYSESVLLGEYVGLGILQEQAQSYNQARNASGPQPFFFELTLFSGIKVRVLHTGEIVLAPTPS